MGRRGVAPEVAHAIPEPAGLDAHLVEIEGETVLVLSFPVQAATLPTSLTASEREVTRAMLAGQGNRAIARARGTTERTVSNQVASIYRKLGVRSRTELGRRLRDATSR